MDGLQVKHLYSDLYIIPRPGKERTSSTYFIHLHRDGKLDTIWSYNDIDRALSLSVAHIPLSLALQYRKHTFSVIFGRP